MSRRTLLLVVIGLGVLVRLGVLLLYLDRHGWVGETWETEVVASNLLQGDGYGFAMHNTLYRSYSVPVFPLVSYLLHRLGGPGLAAYYTFHLLSAAGLIWLTHAIAIRWFGASTAVLAATLVAFEPGLVMYGSYKVEPTTLTTLLMLAAFYLFVAMTCSFDWLRALGAGLLIGLGVLTRSEPIVTLALIPVWLLFERKRWRSLVIPACVVVLGTALSMSPWLIRNYAIHGQLLLTTTSGETLWRGNNPNSTGTTVTTDLRAQFDAAPEEFRGRILRGGELEQNSLFQQEALDFIAGDPVGFLRRATTKFYYFWWFTPMFGTQHYEWILPQLMGAYKGLYLLLLAATAIGLYRLVRYSDEDGRRVVVYLMTVVVMTGALHAIYYVEGRHRVLVMPFLLIVAAQGLTLLGRRTPPHLM